MVYFFYDQYCRECQKALALIDGFKERHPEVVVRSFDIANNPDNQQLFQQFNNRYGVPFSSVPAVFTGEWKLMRNDNIQGHLDKSVLQEETNLTSAIPEKFPSVPSSQTSTTTGMTVPLIIIAAFLDGLNPCAPAVMIFLFVTIMSAGSGKRMLQVGFVYIGAVFLFYFLSGLGVFAMVQVSGIPKIFSTIAARVAILAGIIMIKEALFPGRGVLFLE